MNERNALKKRPPESERINNRLSAPASAPVRAPSAPAPSAEKHTDTSLRGSVSYMLCVERMMSVRQAGDMAEENRRKRHQKTRSYERAG